MERRSLEPKISKIWKIKKVKKNKYNLETRRDLGGGQRRAHALDQGLEPLGKAGLSLEGGARKVIVMWSL